MSLFPINSYEKKNDHNWYTASAISAASASMVGKSFAVEMTSAMSIAPSTGAGKVLGASSIAIAPNTQQTMIARYSENSTEQNPVITVSLGEHGSFDISIKDVDPKSANQIEMFALCSYMDDKNLTCPGSNGSYNRLKSYIQTAIDMDELPDINSHFNAQKKINWTKGLDIAMKNDVTNEYTYMERSEQVKLRGFFEKQHKEIEIRRMLAMANR